MASAPSLSRDEYFNYLIHKYEINLSYAHKLQKLQDFKIVFIFDDSGSMNTSLDDSPLNGNNLIKAKRWDELQHFSTIAIEICSLFDRCGCDVYFLNKGLVKNVATSHQLINYFIVGPGGSTPLTETFNKVVQDNLETIKEKKLLILIVTDGEPTANGQIDIAGFKKCLNNRNTEKIFVGIIACTDDKKSMKYLNKWDKKIKNLDVVDDFRTEKKQIKGYFSYGDYVVKSLVGSTCSKLDKKDEHCILL